MNVASTVLPASQVKNARMDFASAIVLISASGESAEGGLDSGAQLASKSTVAAQVAPFLCPHPGPGVPGCCAQTMIASPVAAPATAGTTIRLIICFSSNTFGPRSVGEGDLSECRTLKGRLDHLVRGRGVHDADFQMS